ncbi:MAG TPA: YihY/virulence factor BrkB family protein [Bacteroidales bacterium]|nr:YihY/virulence factor BrkB family protein [Bacteroidales bacterium]
MKKVKELWQVMKEAGQAFSKHNVPKLSASLCYYALFSLGPMLLIIIFISDLFWGRQAVEGTMYSQIEGFIGDKAAEQIQQILKNTRLSDNSLMAVVGIITLVFASTTGFNEIHDSINIIWNLRIKKGREFKRMLKTRLLSFLIIFGLGVLMILFLILNGILEGFMGNLQEIFPRVSVYLVYIVNLAVTLFIVSLLFASIYKLLPDAYIPLKYVIGGAIFTAILFMIGKYGITLYLKFGNMSSAYGPAGSLVVLILWIYYSAMILYFGAEVTKAYAVKFGDAIRPKPYAVTVKVIQVESNETSVQKNEEANDLNPSVKSQ